MATNYIVAGTDRPVKNLYADDVSAKETLGRMVNLDDGRRCRYVQFRGPVNAGEATKRCLSKVHLANTHISTGPTTGGSGFLAVSQASLTVQDNFAGGYVVLKDGAGEGQYRQITGHPAFAAANSATGILSGCGIKVMLDYPWTTSPSTSTVADLVQPWRVLESTSTAAEIPGGTALRYHSTSNYFGWVQEGGVTAVKAEQSDISPGLSIALGLVTAGSVTRIGTSTESVDTDAPAIMGYCITDPSLYSAFGLAILDI